MMMITSFRDVDKAIERSPYRDNLLLLQQNKDPFSQELRQDIREAKYPNCFGTLVFLLDAERHLLDQFSIVKKNGIIVLGNERSASTSFIPCTFDRPGYVSAGHMERFLSTYCSPAFEHSPANIITTYEYNRLKFPIKTLLHGMLYLGFIQGEEYVYEKDGQGGSFQSARLDAVTNIRDRKIFHYTG